MDNTYNMLMTYVPIAIETSINACSHGAPLGGSLSWLYIILMSNDSGYYPWAPFQAAIIGYPIVILCDAALVVPSLVVSVLKSRGILEH
jgi:hypothetical protein